MIGYTPDRATFVKQGATIPSHKISLRVKRAGLKVRTHQSFIGRLETPPRPANTPQNALLEAAMSPFATTTMAIKLTPLWSYSTTGGASVKALLHLDSGDLTFVPGDDGRTIATAELVGLVVGADGRVVAGRNATVSVSRRPGDTRTSGVTYSLVVPVPQPGGYQLRFGIRDTNSNTTGSVGEFIEVPDVGRGVFALSSVALGGRDIPGDAIDDAARIDGDSAPAVRQFNPGDDLIYSCNIYNGDDAVERSATIWRDGKQVLTAPADSLEVAAGRVIGALRLTAEVAPGDYVLQIDARTATGRKPPSTATTRVDFHVK
jgi:hypothetical protein